MCGKLSCSANCRQKVVLPQQLVPTTTIRACLARMVASLIPRIFLFSRRELGVHRQLVLDDPLGGGGADVLDLAGGNNQVDQKDQSADGADERGNLQSAERGAVIDFVERPDPVGELQERV